MHKLLAFISRMDLIAWGVGIFIAHALFYLALGTRTWLTTALLAAIVYAVVLGVAKSYAKRYLDKEGAR